MKYIKENEVYITNDKDVYIGTKENIYRIANLKSLDSEYSFYSRILNNPNENEPLNIFSTSLKYLNGEWMIESRESDIGLLAMLNYPKEMDSIDITEHVETVKFTDSFYRVTIPISVKYNSGKWNVTSELGYIKCINFSKEDFIYE